MIVASNASLGPGGRLLGSRNASNVCGVPGANSAPSKACLPADSSTLCTRAMARAARRSKSWSTRCLRRFLLWMHLRCTAGLHATSSSTDLQRNPEQKKRWRSINNFQPLFLSLSAVLVELISFLPKPNSWRCELGLCRNEALSSSPQLSEKNPPPNQPYPVPPMRLGSLG